MNRQLVQITLVVEDYDAAIAFYTMKLGFTLMEDTRLSDTKRWVRLSPDGGESCCLLLGKAATPEQKSHIGNQTGGRVFLFIHTDDFYRDYDSWTSKGVELVRPISVEEYGTVAVFKDLYGNMIDLIEPRS
ncbi:MAG: VOC family protein [Saprospiraceae bacterium]|nr:VOC family protein [Saprospiraceae bacterium]